MARYGLATHVFVCRDEEYVVVLDLKQDRYSALEAVKTAAVGLLVPGWPVAADSAGASGEAALAPLLRRGWVLEESSNSKEATPVRVIAPAAELMSGESGTKLSVSMLFAFVMSSLFAKFALRFWGLERVVDRVARRKARGRGQPLDLERARQLVDAFARLRVFLFSTRDECLRDSLAVLEFLARYDIYPSWVFGVRARPFAAHCWVQHEDVVFNDTAEHVVTYVPIMAV
jgi:hypothetical protein